MRWICLPGCTERRAVIRLKDVMAVLRAGTEWDKDTYTTKPFEVVRTVKLDNKPWFARQKILAARQTAETEPEAL